MSSKKTLNIRSSELNLTNFSANKIKIKPLDLYNSFEIMQEPKDNFESTPLSHLKTQ